MKQVYFKTPISLYEIKKTYTDDVEFLSDTTIFPLVKGIAFEGSLHKAIKGKKKLLNIKDKVDRLLELYKRKLFRVWDDKIQQVIDTTPVKKAEGDTNENKKEIIAEILGSLSMELGSTAIDYYKQAYFLGKQRGVSISGKEFRGAISETGKEKILTLQDKNQAYLDNFMGDLNQKYADALDKEYASKEAQEAEIKRISESAESRLSLYVPAVLAALAIGLNEGLARLGQAALDTEFPEGTQLPEGKQPPAYEQPPVGMVPPTETEAPEEVTGIIWVTNHDDSVCLGCEENDGKFFTFDEFEQEYQTNECLSNCRCAETSEPTTQPAEHFARSARVGDLHKGGPGSGCNPAVGDCGRPEGSGTATTVKRPGIPKFEWTPEHETKFKIDFQQAHPTLDRHNQEEKTKAIVASAREQYQDNVELDQIGKVVRAKKSYFSGIGTPNLPDNSKLSHEGDIKTPKKFILTTENADIPVNTGNATYPSTINNLDNEKSIGQVKDNDKGANQTRRYVLRDSFQTYPQHLQQRLTTSIRKVTYVESNHDAAGTYIGFRNNVTPEALTLNPRQATIELNNRMFDDTSITRTTQHLIITHELAHALDYSYIKDKGVKFSMTKEWKEAMLKGRPVTAYAKKNEREYFAESVTAYLFVPDHLQKANPRAFSLIDNLFKDKTEGMSFKKQDLSTVPFDEKPAIEIDDFKGSIIEYILAALAEDNTVEKGGPGSGCNPAVGTCGRPSTGNSNDLKSLVNEHIQIYNTGEKTFTPIKFPDGLTFDNLKGTQDELKDKRVLGLATGKYKFLFNPGTNDTVVFPFAREHGTIFDENKKNLELAGEIDDTWSRMQYSKDLDGTPVIELDYWHGKESDDPKYQNYISTLASVINNKTFPDNVELKTWEVRNGFKQSRTLGEWREIFKMEKGGPGSGCNPAAGECGRPATSTQEEHKIPDYHTFKIGNKEVQVIKNPTQGDYGILNEQFKEKFPRAGQGEPKTRFAYDSKGNRYEWMADTTHDEVQQHFKNNFDLEINQNQSILSTPKINIDEIRPALNDSGRIFVGKKGQLHAGIYNDNEGNFNDESNVETGFVDKDGNWINRKELDSLTGAFLSEELTELQESAQKFDSFLSLRKGGPGSGCNPAVGTCGRPSTGTSNNGLSEIGDEVGNQQPEIDKPFLVFRVGSKNTTLSNRNAGNANGVAEHLIRYSDEEGPELAGGLGTHITAFKVVATKPFGKYGHFNQGDGGAFGNRLSIGRSENKGIINYSFPENGNWKIIERGKTISVSELNVYIKDNYKYKNVYMAGSDIAGKALREMFNKKIEKGGPGSGCNPAVGDCGRPEGSGTATATATLELPSKETARPQTTYKPAFQQHQKGTPEYEENKRVLQTKFDSYLNKDDIISGSEEDIKFMRENLPEVMTAYDNATMKEYGTSVPVVASADIIKTMDMPGRPKFTAKDSELRHAASSAVGKIFIEQRLNDPKTAGKTVWSFAGVSGSGKTTIIKQSGTALGLDKAALVVDSNLNNPKSGTKAINRALDTGHPTNVVLVERDPVESFTNGVYPRFKNPKYSGRLIPIAIHMQNANARESFKTFIKPFEENKMVNAYAIENVPNQAPKILAIDSLKPLGYTMGEAKTKIRSFIDEKYKQHDMTREEYNAFIRE